jgi:hypothetical protein
MASLLVSGRPHPVIAGIVGDLGEAEFLEQRHAQGRTHAPGPFGTRSFYPERTWRVPPIFLEPQPVQPIKPMPSVMAAPWLTNPQPFRKTVKLSAPGLTLMIV